MRSGLIGSHLAASPPLGQRDRQLHLSSLLITFGGWGSLTLGKWYEGDV